MASSRTDERFGFICEYLDTQADLIRRYQLIYFVSDKTIEMHDLKSRAFFLKRCEYPGIRIQDLFLGNLITVYSRQLKIVDYADDYTRTKLGKREERTLAMIKPDAYEHTGKIVNAILETGMTIGNIRMFRLRQQDAEAFYAVHADKPFYPALVEYMTSDYITAIEILGEDAVARWRALIGPTSPDRARTEAPRSLRAQFGRDNTRNSVHGSDSQENARKEIDFFFGAGARDLPTTATYSHCTLGLIKPHAVTQGHAGKIIDAILADGFEISALQQFVVDKVNAEDFLEVYKGVVGEYQHIVDQLSSGPCIAMEIRAENSVQAFRELCGPHDPEIAKILRPKTLRARFGSDKVRNGVHCTDLPDDGVLEVEFFFGLLFNRK